MPERLPTDAKVGYLTKTPRHRYLLFFPRPHRRFFVASERWIQWYVDEASAGAPRGRMLLEGAKVGRDGKSGAIVLKTLASDRIVLTGDDLDGWEAALRDRCNLLTGGDRGLQMAVAPEEETPIHLLSQELRALSSLDDKLIAAFRREDIRLLRSSWLLQQPPGFKLPRRQDLEAREREEASPLLSGEEAAELISACGRGMGSLTHGWLTPGARIHCAAVEQRFGSLPVPPAPTCVLLHRRPRSGG